ncbi:sulfurtransferase TusA family protein [Desulfurococcaceae archaeon MEX13E-LK6-19]|nr:sulfurtransferase TusA family protein [Desulfurococcaceae archaeon MEX13E-LK6-19]
MNSVENLIDLRKQPKGCKEHPLIRLKNTIRRMKKGESIKVITDTTTIPLRTIEIIARKNELKVEIIGKNNNVYEIVLRKE